MSNGEKWTLASIILLSISVIALAGAIINMDRQWEERDEVFTEYLHKLNKTVNGYWIVSHEEPDGHMFPGDRKESLHWRISTNEEVSKAHKEAIDLLMGHLNLEFVPGIESVAIREKPTLTFFHDVNNGPTFPNIGALGKILNDSTMETP